MPTVIDGTTGIDLVQDGAIGTAKLAAGAVTPAKLSTAATPLGVGQTWQNLTASRVIGTSYTNTTGRPISWSISTNGTAGGNQVVDGVSASTLSGSSSSSVSVIVPPGSAYSLTGSTGVLVWAELR